METRITEFKQASPNKYHLCPLMLSSDFIVMLQLKTCVCSRIIVGSQKSVRAGGLLLFTLDADAWKVKIQKLSSRRDQSGAKQTDESKRQQNSEAFLSYFAQFLLCSLCIRIPWPLFSSKLRLFTCWLLFNHTAFTTCLLLQQTVLANMVY